MRKLPVIAGLALVICGPALAQGSMEDRLRDQLRQTTLQLRELQNSQAGLQAAKAAAEQERDALRKQLAARKPAAAPAIDPARLNELRAENATLERRAADARAALEQANGEMTKANELIRQLQAEKAQAQSAAAAAAQPVTDLRNAIHACTVKNQRLIDISNEILNAYEKIGAGRIFLAREPFVQSKRVQLENEAQAFGDRIHLSRCMPELDQRTPAPEAAPLTTNPAGP